MNFGRTARTVLVGSITVVVAAAAFLFVLGKAPSTASAAVPDAILDLEAGTIGLLRPDSDIWVIGADGDPLPAGTRVRSRADTQGAVIFFEGSVISLRGTGELVVEQMGGDYATGATQIGVVQVAGSTWNRVSKLVDADSSYSVQTSNRVGLVRGTVFKVHVDGDTTTIAALEGVVLLAKDLSAGSLVQAVDVIPNTQASIVGEDPPHPAGTLRTYRGRRRSRPVPARGRSGASPRPATGADPHPHLHALPG